ncbi:MAG: hypothetical protein HYZ34_03715 [Ignavibacteriae bacterium]|nr:hypothetical protein [Ignavibacteriota bacterium]
MKSFLRLFIFASILFILSSCTTELPKVRVSNQRTEIIDVQLKRSGGSTYNINDVVGFSSTGYIEVERNVYEVDVKIEENAKSASTFFVAEEDKTYTIVLSSTNPPIVTVTKP